MTKAKRKAVIDTVRDRMARDLCPAPDPDSRDRGVYQRAAWAIKLGPDVVQLYIDGSKFKERHLIELWKAKNRVVGGPDPAGFVTCLNTLGIPNEMRDRIMLAAGFLMPTVKVALASVTCRAGSIGSDFKYLVTNLIDNGEVKSMADLRKAMDDLVAIATAFRATLT